MSTSTKAGHTPGPWMLFAQYLPEIGQIGYSALSPYILDSAGETIAAVMLGNKHSDQQIFADMRLIAAAPDLLAALETALQHLLPTTERNCAGYAVTKRGAIEKARAALAKAKEGMGT